MGVSLPSAALAAALAAARGALRVTEEMAGEEGQLAVEMTVLDRLLYQSTGQHRMQKYFQGLAKVRLAEPSPNAVEYSYIIGPESRLRVAVV